MPAVSFPFRPWVRSTSRRALLWGIAVVLAIGGAVLLLSGSERAAWGRAFGVLLAYSLLFWASLVKIWWTAGRPAVALDEDGLAFIAPFLAGGWGGLLNFNLDDPSDHGEWIQSLTAADVRTIDRYGGTHLHTSRTNPGRVRESAMPEFLKGRFAFDGPKNTADCTPVVLDCVQLRFDNSYLIPNYRTSGTVYITGTVYDWSTHAPQPGWVVAGTRTTRSPP